MSLYTCNSACVCAHMCGCGCGCVGVNFRCILSSWSSKGALANLKDTAKAMDIQEAIAKSDCSTAELLLHEVSSGKQRCPSSQCDLVVSACFVNNTGHLCA